MLPLHIHAIGVTTSLGLDLRNTAAAVRCRLSNFAETAFLDHGGERILAAQVPFDPPLWGQRRLDQILRLAIADSLRQQTILDPSATAILLCVAEGERPGRIDGLDECLMKITMESTGLPWSIHSHIIAGNRCGPVQALALADSLLTQGRVNQVIIVAVDSYISADTLKAYDEQARLLTKDHSDGFIPGEAAAALLVGHTPVPGGCGLACVGWGQAEEPAPRDSGRPSRADGLSRAIRQAATAAGITVADCDWHLSDADGSQFAFREVSSAVARSLKTRKSEFQHLTPIDCLGQVGTAILPCLFGIAVEAHRRGWSAGPRTLCHVADDGPGRAAVILAPSTETP